MGDGLGLFPSEMLYSSEKPQFARYEKCTCSRAQHSARRVPERVYSRQLFRLSSLLTLALSTFNTILSIFWRQAPASQLSLSLGLGWVGFALDGPVGCS